MLAPRCGLGYTKFASPEISQYYSAGGGAAVEGSPESFRFINAYKVTTGKLPEKITIQRYDSEMGAHVATETCKPEDVLPKGTRKK